LQDDVTNTIRLLLLEEDSRSPEPLSKDTHRVLSHRSEWTAVGDRRAQREDNNMDNESELTVFGSVPTRALGEDAGGQCQVDTSYKSPSMSDSPSPSPHPTSAMAPQIPYSINCENDPGNDKKTGVHYGGYYHTEVLPVKLYSSSELLARYPML
jgi:hypothetical protein